MNQTKNDIQLDNTLNNISSALDSIKELALDSLIRHQLDRQDGKLDNLTRQTDDCSLRLRSASRKIRKRL